MLGHYKALNGGEVVCRPSSAPSPEHVARCLNYLDMTSKDLSLESQEKRHMMSIESAKMGWRPLALIAIAAADFTAVVPGQVDP